jgi:hypothetical protein
MYLKIYKSAEDKEPLLLISSITEFSIGVVKSSVAGVCGWRCAPVLFLRWILYPMNSTLYEEEFFRYLLIRYLLMASAASVYVKMVNNGNETLFWARVTEFKIEATEKGYVGSIMLELEWTAENAQNTTWHGIKIEGDED